MVTELQKAGDRYACPLYKCSNRQGVLSTSGHSNNYIMDVQLPVTKHEADHWIKRGVALISQTDV